MIAPLSDEEEAQLAGYSFKTTPDSSLLRRAGAHAANLPSDLFSDIARLSFNLGIKSPDQTAATDFPKVFDVPPAATLGEGAIDIGATLARSLPLIMSGEGAGAGLAELAGVAPTMAKIIGSATGFGVAGLTESPEQGAASAGLGAAFRGADFLPLKYKIPLATAIGLATGGEAYAHDPNATKAVGIGAVNALLPFVIGGRIEKDLAKTRTEVPGPGAPMAGANPDVIITPFSGRNDGSVIAPPYRPPGSLVADHLNADDFLKLEQKRAGLPPKGALTRDPLFTADEALRGSRPVATSQFRLTSEPELDFPAPNGVNGVPPAPANQQPLFFRPEGSLIREAAITPGEIGRVLEARKPPPLLAPAPAETIPATSAPATFKQTPAEGFEPHKAQITGPHVVSTAYEDNGIHRVGPEFNTPHEGIGAYHENFEGVPEQSRGFIVQDADGSQRFTKDRVEAQSIAKQAGQTATPNAVELQSQELRKAATPALGDATPIELTADHGNQLAEQFGLKYNGVQKGYKTAPGFLQFQDTKASGTAVAAIEGRSVAEFREHIKATREKFDRAPVATLQENVIPFRPAVKYRGETFEAGTHEDAIAKLAKKFPDYRSTNRQTEPIVRGYLNTSNQFEPNLLNVARAAEAEVKPLTTHVIPDELHTPGTRGSIQTLGSDADRVAALDAVKGGTKPVTIMSGPSNDFVKEAKDRGLKIARFKTDQSRTVTVAHNSNPAAVKAIKEAYLSKLPNDERDVLMGKALGFRQEEIEDFIGGRISHQAAVAEELPPTKVATLQDPIDEAKLSVIKLKPEVKGSTVKIGDASYVLNKNKAGIWEYEGQPLARSKQEAVQQIKELHAASTSPAPSLENTESKLAVAADGQRQVGDKVFVDFDGTPEIATVVKPNSDTGIHQVRLADNSIVDVRDSKITAVPNGGKFEATRAGEIKQIGALEDFRRLEKDNAIKASGLKMRRPIGEAGSIPIETAIALSRYVVAPIVGAAVGAAMSDQDHRLQGAMEGAIALGLVGVFGPRLFSLLAEGHADINDPASLPAAVKRTVLAAKVATLQPQEAIFRASVTGHASNFDKIALWMSRHLTTDLQASRLIMRARGEIEILGAALHKAIPALARAHKEGLTEEESKLIGDYFKGKVPQKEFEAKLGKPALAQSATVAAQSRRALQEIVVKGVTDSGLKTKIMDSFNDYLTTSYRIFTEKKYFPSEEQIAKVAQQIRDEPGHSLAGTPLEVRIRVVTQELKDLKANKGLFGGGRSGESLAAAMFNKKDLTAAYKDALGEHLDPIENIIATVNKLVPLARSAEFFNEVANGVRDDGLKYAYSEPEMVALLDNLRARSAAATIARDDAQVATLQSQIEKLKGYEKNGENESHGRLSNQFLDRRMHDALAQRDALIQESNTFVARHLRNATTLFKYNKTVLSPLQFTKQILNVPLLGLMSRTGPSHWAGALKSLYDPATRERLTRLGVASGDIVAGLLNHDLNALLKGNLDKFSFSNPIVSGLHKWQELWRTPDLVVRVAAFQKEEARLLRMIPDSLEGEARAIAVQKAENAAIDYTNRYTMNYEVIPTGVRIFSNVPFFNQFLTWAFEITRITKNVAQDAIGQGPSGKVDPYAIAALASLGGAPFALQKASEAMLSPKDQKDWEKAKALLPDYARGNFVWVTHRDAKGHFHYINFTGLVIHDSYLKMFRDLMHGDKAAFKADNPLMGWENTPLLNVATNQISGQDIHTGQKFRTFSDRVGSVRRDFAPTIVGTDFDKFVKALTPNADGGLGVTDVRTGQSTTIGGLLLSYATAVRGYTTDLSALQRRALSAAQADINDQRADLTRLLRSNARDDVKQRAVDQFRFMQRQIMLELGNQLKS